MKKLFFTAIAMIAFSSASMANTNAKEETVTKEHHPCVQQWIDDMDVLMDGYGATFEEAEAIADNCFNECLDAYFPLN